MTFFILQRPCWECVWSSASRHSFSLMNNSQEIISNWVVWLRGRGSGRRVRRAGEMLRSRLGRRWVCREETDAVSPREMREETSKQGMQGNTETAERVQEHGDRQTGGPSGAQQASQGELGTVAVWGPTAQPTLIRSVSRWPLALSGVVYSRNQI